MSNCMKKSLPSYNQFAIVLYCIADLAALSQAVSVNMHSGSAGTIYGV